MRHLAKRRASTLSRVKKLQDQLKRANSIAGDKACIYMTGSFGRVESSKHSDLDIFIVGKSQVDPRDTKRQISSLRRLDEIIIKADLIQTIRKHKIPEFSGDGQYLEHYPSHELINALGTQDDDFNNTFTARLLLLLESRPLLGESVYQDIIEDVIAAYWRDYADHKDKFVPAFLANDILRLWRTFCVNYEARIQRDPAEQKAKGKLKNYKLKYSRMMTCYSALIFLLDEFGKHKTVSPDAALRMVALSPTERLEDLLRRSSSKRQEAIQRLLDFYDEFLSVTDASEDSLLSRFQDKRDANLLIEKAFEFGDTVYQTLMMFGNNTRLHRLLVV